MHFRVGSLLGGRIRLHLSLAPDLPRVSGDAVQLEQVLMNLAVNARDAGAGLAGRRIPVVEDETLLRDMLADALALDSRVRLLPKPFEMPRLMALMVELLRPPETGVPSR